MSLLLLDSRGLFLARCHGWSYFHCQCSTVKFLPLVSSECSHYTVNHFSIITLAPLTSATLFQSTLSSPSLLSTPRPFPVSHLILPPCPLFSALPLAVSLSPALAPLGHCLLMPSLSLTLLP